MLIGVRVARKIDPDKLRKLFGWFVLIVGSFTLIDKSQALTTIGDYATESSEHMIIVVIVVFLLALAAAVAFTITKRHRDAKDIRIPSDFE